MRWDGYTAELCVSEDRWCTEHFNWSQASMENVLFDGELWDYRTAFRKLASSQHLPVNAWTCNPVYASLPNTGRGVYDLLKKPEESNPVSFVLVQETTKSSPIPHSNPWVLNQDWSHQTGCWFGWWRYQQPPSAMAYNWGHVQTSKAGPLAAWAASASWRNIKKCSQLKKTQ